MIVDSHCHLTSTKYNTSIKKILKNCKENKINLLLNISTKESEFAQILEISNKFNEIFNSIGIHPHETENLNFRIFNKINDIIINNKKTIAVGETGLDFYYNNSMKNSQISSFEKHIEMSLEHDLPIIIHSREAEKETKNIIKYYKKNSNLKGVIHCFTGSQKFANDMLDLGFYISASGIVTFSKSNDLRDVFKTIPNNRLLVETDSPYLSPEPLRGKVNQPFHIIHTLKMLANIRGNTFEELCIETTNNFKNLFPKMGIN